MRKLQLRTNSEEQAILFDTEVEPVAHGSDDLRTTYVYRERPATAKEVLMWNAGYGYLIKF
jgi:hypothetical protein